MKNYVLMHKATMLYGEKITLESACNMLLEQGSDYTIKTVKYINSQKDKINELQKQDYMQVKIEAYLNK